MTWRRLTEGFLKSSYELLIGCALLQQGVMCHLELCGLVARVLKLGAETAVILRKGIDCFLQLLEDVVNNY